MICLWQEPEPEQTLSLEALLKIHEIKQKHRILFESDQVMIIDNRGAPSYCDFWDYDVVIFDVFYEAEIGAANKQTDGSYVGFVIHGQNELSVYGHTPEALGFNAIHTAETAALPLLEEFPQRYAAMLDTVKASGLNPQVDEFNYEIGWCFPGQEVEEGSGIAFDGLGVLISCYLIELDPSDPLIILLRVIKFFEPHHRLGPDVSDSIFNKPVFDGLRAKIDLRSAMPRDFRPHDYDFVYFWETIATRWEDECPSNALLERVGNTTIRKNIATCSSE